MENIAMDAKVPSEVMGEQDKARLLALIEQGNLLGAWIDLGRMVMLGFYPETTYALLTLFIRDGMPAVEFPIDNPNPLQHSSPPASEQP